MGSVYASRAELDAWTPSRNLRAAQGNGNDGASPEPRMQPQDTAISTSPPHRGYPTRRILVVAGVAAFLIVSALARKLCSEAREASKDDTLMLDICAKALGNAGELTEAEALAVKKDRLVPEDTRNLKMCLPEIRSIIESERGNAVAAVDLLSPVSHRSSRMDRLGNLCPLGATRTGTNLRQGRRP